MRILHINRNYLGTTLHQTMINHLDSIGVVNQVFVPVCNKDVSVITPNENVLVSNCFNNVDRYIYDLKQYKIIRAIEKKIDVASFDVVHAYTLFTDGNVAMKLAEKYKKPFVVAVRNTDVNDFFAKLFYLRGRGIHVMQKAQRIFFLSEAYRKQVFDNYVPKKLFEELFVKTIIVPNGIDDFWFVNSSLEKKRFSNPIKLIYAGKIDRNKNIPTIQKAMNILQNQGVDSTLTVIGKIVDQGEFDKIKNDSRITYMSAMPKEQLIEQYRNHDIFVMPSFTESFGLVYAEAISQGLPVVYSKGQGFDGQFEEGLVGYHCDAKSADSLANSIKKVMESFYNGKKLNDVDLSKYRWNVLTERYRDVYLDVIGK